MEVHSQSEIIELKIEHWSHARLAKLTFYAACAVRVTIFSAGGKFRPDRFLRSYTLLLWSPVLMHSWYHMHIGIYMYRGLRGMMVA